MEHGLDLVVATRDLPRMSEYDLVRGIRAYSCQTDTSMLVVLAGTDFNQNEVLEAIKAGVHQIVVLPVDKRDLEMKVEAARSMAG